MTVRGSLGSAMMLPDPSPNDSFHRRSDSSFWSVDGGRRRQLMLEHGRPASIRRKIISTLRGAADPPSTVAPDEIEDIDRIYRSSSLLPAIEGRERETKLTQLPIFLDRLLLADLEPFHVGRGEIIILFGGHVELVG